MADLFYNLSCVRDTIAIDFGRTLFLTLIGPKPFRLLGNRVLGSCPSIHSVSLQKSVHGRHGVCVPLAVRMTVTGVSTGH